MIEYEEIKSDEPTFYNEATKFLEMVVSELGLSNIINIYEYIRSGKNDINKFYDYINKKLDKFVNAGKLESWKRLHSSDGVNNLDAMIFLSDYMKELMNIFHTRNGVNSLDYMTDYVFENDQVFSTLDGWKFENPLKYTESVKTIFAYDEERRRVL